MGVLGKVLECMSGYGSDRDGTGVYVRVWSAMEVLEFMSGYGSAREGTGVYVRVWEC